MDDKEWNQQLYQGGASFSTPIARGTKFVPPPNYPPRLARLFKAPSGEHISLYFIYECCVRVAKLIHD
jgi:ABC-type cobalt transport system substrate-binding protein